MSEEEKTGRGGSRVGSGRKKGSVTTGAGKPENKFQFVLPDDAAAWVKAQGGNTWLKAQTLEAFRRRP